MRYGHCVFFAFSARHVDFSITAQSTMESTACDGHHARTPWLLIHEGLLVYTEAQGNGIRQRTYGMMGTLSCIKPELSAQQIDRRPVISDSSLCCPLRLSWVSCPSR